MKFTRMVSKTLRFDSPEAETASHRLMLRAGLIQQVAAGVYSYLPMAFRSLRKIENIIREEMDAAGGQELMLPALQPMELWEQTGRRGAFGDNLFSLHDRRGRPMVMAPTHEEVVTNVVQEQRPELPRPAPAALPDTDQVPRRAPPPRRPHPGARVRHEGTPTPSTPMTTASTTATRTWPRPTATSSAAADCRC